MSRSAITAAALSLLLPAACARGPLPDAAGAGAPRPPAPSASAEETAANEYSGRTRLFYEDSHGNQIVYQDPGGRFFLWYPGNRGALGGDWRMEGQRICFHYDEEYAYNPVTGEYSQWNCRSLAEDDEHVVDTAPGDVFDLATGRVPFRLPAHPRFDSIADVKAPR